MLYDLVFNAVKQALQVQAPTQMNNQDLGELLGVLTLLEKIKISAEKTVEVRAIIMQIEKEILRRNIGDIIIILLYSDSDLTTMIADLTVEERLEILDWLEKYSTEQNGQKISSEERAKIREYLASF